MFSYLSPGLKNKARIPIIIASIDKTIMIPTEEITRATTLIKRAKGTLTMIGNFQTFTQK
jgi:hypothetical protein